MPPDCPQKKSCAMFPLLKLSGTLRAWQSRYCEGDFEACERYRRSSQGRPVPQQLMPNGSMLRGRGNG